VSRPKSAAVEDIDIDIADILGSEISVNIDKGDIDPALICKAAPYYSSLVPSALTLSFI